MNSHVKVVTTIVQIKSYKRNIVFTKIGVDQHAYAHLQRDR